jgi:hypothetical protein
VLRVDRTLCAGITLQAAAIGLWLSDQSIDYRVANAPPRLLHKIEQRLPVNWEGGEIAGAGEPRSWEIESSLSAFGSWRHLGNDVTHLA